MQNILKQQRFLLLILFVSILPFILNLLGIDFSSTSINFLDTRNTLAEVTADDKFHAIKGGMHHALLEWTAVSIALVAGVASFLHYYLYRDVSVPVIGMALLCAGFTDAFHTLAATRIISANVPNTDFIPFTWAFSRIFNASLMIIGVAISVYIRNKYFLVGSKAQFKWQERYGFRILIIVSCIFVGFAIIAVIIAATSDSLPQTTFKHAFITRPYDVLPLALFFFSGALAWTWYKKTPTIVGYALLLSLIPEIITQVHMAFGSTSLFDNHFNIAHGLKVIAYICLLGGILTSLLDPSRQNNITLQSSEGSHKKNIHWQKTNLNLLKVGSAKYPQVVVIPVFTFALALLVTVLITKTYQYDTEKLFVQEKLSRLNEEAIVIEKFVKKIYERGEREVISLSNTPPVQNIIKAITNGDLKSDSIWRSRLNTIFQSLINKESVYEEIRFVQLAGDNKELVKAYRQSNQVFVTPKIKLTKVLDKNLFKHLNDLPGHISFNTDSLNTDTQQYSKLKIVRPIYNKDSQTPFGLIELQINLSLFINHLKLDSLFNRKLLIATSDGHILSDYQSGHYERTHFKAGELLQNLLPELTEAVAENAPALDLVNFSNTNSNDEVSELLNGHYRTMIMKVGEVTSILRVFIFLDTNDLQASLNNFNNRSWMIGIGLAVLALAFAIISSRKITQPMQDIIQELLRYEYTGEVKNLPTNAKDEVGVFSRSFHNMLIHQKEKDNELLRQKFALDEHSIVSMTDVKGNITYVNEKFCEISEFSEDELMGENHRILNSGYHGLTFFEEMFAGLVVGKTWNGAICNRSKSGKTYWVQTTIVPFMNEKGKPESYISIRTDITQSKMDAIEIIETRDILSFQVAQLQEANADLDQFAYVASHDLKSPLNGISQLVSWIDEDCRDILPEESKEHLNLLKSRSRRMLNLLNDLLEYSRIGRDEHAKEIINLKEVTQEIFELQGNHDGFSCKGQDIDFEIQRIPFEMVLRNLISNAIKHHDKKSGHIEVCYELVKDNEKHLHQFKITDDGPGIPTDLQEKAVEMFQTLQSRDETEGSGMGLAMVKKMADKYEGGLAIESDGIRGTTFIVQWGV